jgi:hypothetical protein
VGTLARVASAQVPQPQRLPATTTIDTVNAVTVQNDRKTPVSVYMDVGTLDHRLGVVPARDSRSLALPAWALYRHLRVQLFVRADGEPGFLSTPAFSLEAPMRVALLVPAWGATAAPPDTMTEAMPPDVAADATLTVDNGRDRRLTVYARQGLSDVRLGEVPARSRATLRFPKSVALPSGSIALRVRPEGGPNLSSRAMRVQRGDHLGLRVPGY